MPSKNLENHNSGSYVTKSPVQRAFKTQLNIFSSQIEMLTSNFGENYIKEIER